MHNFSTGILTLQEKHKHTVPIIQCEGFTLKTLQRVSREHGGVTLTDRYLYVQHLDRLAKEVLINVDIHSQVMIVGELHFEVGLLFLKHNELKQKNKQCKKWTAQVRLNKA